MGLFPRAGHSACRSFGSFRPAALVVAAVLLPSIAHAQTHGVVRASAGIDPTVFVVGGGAAYGPGTIFFEPYGEIGAGSDGVAVRGGLELSLRIAQIRDRLWLYVGVGTDATITRQTSRLGRDWQLGGNVIGLAGVKNRQGFFGQVAVGPPGSFANPVVVVSVGKIFGAQ